VDPRTHKRYLDYRERHAYFGKRQKQLSMDEFAKAESELQPLEAKGERRDDDEEARFAELCRELLRD
jgi:hypothetical protein